MRATERLLELIAERARLVDEGELLTQEGIMEIRQAVDELRRRGDTLVTGRDLELIIQALARERVALGEDEAQALVASTARWEVRRRTLQGMATATRSAACSCST